MLESSQNTIPLIDKEEAVKLLKLAEEFEITDRKSHAIPFYKKAAQLGYAEAQYRLATIYDEFNPNYQIKMKSAKAAKIALKLYKRAAAQRHIGASVHLGVFYEQQLPRLVLTTKKHKRIIYYFTQAAKEGSVKAQCLLGDFYLEKAKDNYQTVFGRVPSYEHYAAAYKWYGEAACCKNNQYENYVKYAKQQIQKHNLHAIVNQWERLKNKDV